MSTILQNLGNNQDSPQGTTQNTPQKSASSPQPVLLNRKQRQKNKRKARRAETKGWVDPYVCPYSVSPTGGLVIDMTKLTPAAQRGIRLMAQTKGAK